MSRSTWDRLSAASGIGFAIAFIAAFLVAGDVPGLNDSARDVQAWYGDNSGRVLVGVVLFGIALALFLWFVGTLANTLREADEGRPAAVTLASGAAIVAFASMQAILIAGLAHSIAGSADASVVKALNNAQWVVQTLVAFPAFVLVSATAAAALRSGVLPRWFGLASLAGAVVFAANTTTWARDGFWAPDGAYSAIIASLVFIVWAAGASALLLQRVMSMEEKRRMAAPLPA
jgi:hypothetical protein